ncbi:MAG TPA: NFACT family protein [Spirochaetia bacterium]|nr:NFACT family protein [Spirochaetia bacterium]
MTESGATSLNWKEIDLVLTELSLPGSLVQEIHQPSHDRFILSLFRAGAAFSVLISLSSRLPRIHVISQKPANPPRPPRFASFLRAHVKGGRIESAEQLRSEGAVAEGQRVVRIAVLRGGEEKILWVRLWGSAANAVLTDAGGTILDAFYRRPNKGEVSGKRFTPIPASRTPARGEARGRFAIRELPGEGTFNEKLERHFHALETRVDVQKLSAQADLQLEISENKLMANLEKLRARLEEYGNLERFRELGDLITSNLHAVVRGERWLKAEDFFHDNAQVDIELSPGLSPAQNAGMYYERHRKARLGRSRVEEEIQRLEQMLQRIKAKRAALASNPDPASLARAAASAEKARKPLASADAPGLAFSSPPFRIFVGRTASENDELLRKKVRGNDWWFHARDWPGAYVFVKAPAGKSLPLETMLDAGNLAVHYSRGKSAGTADVYYTRVKYLRRAKGARKGTVLPTQEKNLRISLDPARIERLKTGTADSP